MCPQAEGVSCGVVKTEEVWISCESRLRMYRFVALLDSFMKRITIGWGKWSPGVFRLCA